MGPDGQPLRLVVRTGQRRVAIDAARAELIGDRKVRIAGLSHAELRALPSAAQHEKEVALSRLRPR